MIASEQSIELAPKEKRVLFLIGSTWKSRLWEMEYYGTLANLLNEEYGFQSFIVGSPNDDVLANSILSASNVPVVNLVGKTTLREFKTLCSLASFGVGSDSGPLHIASGVGLAVISLWGPTSPTRSKPFNNFQNALQSPVGCAGCYHRICPGLDKLCMKSIRPEVVMMKIQAFK
jgi:heptosyltransferase-1